MYILVCTCTYYIPLFGTMLWYMAVRDSGQVDVRSPPSLVPIDPLSYRHKPAWIYLSGFVHPSRFLRESWCIPLCYCTYTDIRVYTVAQVNISWYIAILLESYTPGRNQTSLYMSVWRGIDWYKTWWTTDIHITRILYSSMVPNNRIS